MKYFRADAATYEHVRAEIDAAMGWPDEGTATSIEPAVTAPRDAEGRVLLACQNWLSVVAEEWLAQMEQINDATWSESASAGRRLP